MLNNAVVLTPEGELLDCDSLSETYPTGDFLMIIHDRWAEMTCFIE